MSLLYSPAVLDHFQSPRNAGDLPDATAGVDVPRLSARFHAGRVAEARFKAQGCVASIACGSWLTEWMVGKSAGELNALTADHVAAALGGLAPASAHAAE